MRRLSVAFEKENICAYLVKGGIVSDSERFIFRFELNNYCMKPAKPRGLVKHVAPEKVHEGPKQDQCYGLLKSGEEAQIRHTSDVERLVLRKQESCNLCTTDASNQQKPLYDIHRKQGAYVHFWSKPSRAQSVQRKFYEDL